MDVWLQRVGTQECLRSYLIQYARERGQVRFENIVWGKSRQFPDLDMSMDKIGRQMFMEGMILEKAGGCNLPLENWAKDQRSDG